jgi:hypothetical protein
MSPLAARPTGFTTPSTPANLIDSMHYMADKSDGETGDES